MVLRKPYAFLIKHFRFIHLIITTLLGYVAFKNREVYKYINEVIKNTSLRYDALDYIAYRVFFYIAIILFCLAIYYLLKYKNKPRSIYMITIFGYIFVFGFMVVLYSYMNNFHNIAIDQKTIRLYRDILNITLWFQYYIIVIMTIRTLGFDIKRFDFRRDVQELNMDAADGEEIEIDTQIDTTNAKMIVRKQLREFGYFFKEYKLYIITILIIIIAIVGYNVYNYMSDLYTVYNEGDYIGGLYNIAVKDSYYYTKNNNNNVVVNFDISKYGVTDKFTVSNLVLVVGKKKYIADKNICYKFSRFGNCYKNQYVSDDMSNYILVYELDDILEENAYLVYNESYNNSYRIKLSLKEYK